MHYTNKIISFYKILNKLPINLLNIRFAGLFILLQLVFIIPVKGQLNFDYYLERGRQKLYYYNYSQAIEDFNFIIEQKPYAPEAYFLRAIAKYNLGDFYGAEQDYSKAIDLKPNAAKAYYYRGMTRIQLYNFNGAINDFNKTIDFVNPDAELFIQRGYSKFRLEKYNGAVEDFNKAIQYHNKAKRAYYYRAVTYLNTQDTAKAIEDLTTAIKLDSNYIDAYINRGRIYYQQKKYPKALYDLNSAVEKDSNNSSALISRSMIYYETDSLQRAMQDLNHIIEIEPSNALAYYNRALLRTEIGAYDKAIEDYNQVLKYNPQNILSYFNRGLVQMERNAYSKAIRDFSLAIDLYPNFAKAYINRSIARARLEDYQGAQRDRQIARQIYSDYKDNQLEQINFADTSENFRRLISLQGSKNLPQQFGNLKQSVEPFDNFTLYYNKSNKKNVVFTINQYTDNDTLAGQFKYLDSEYLFDFNFKSSVSTDEINNKISELSESMKTYPDSIIIKLKYALLKGLTKNYNEAIGLLTELIESGDTHFLNYFIRANMRSKMIHYIKMMKDEAKIINIDIDNNLFADQPIKKEVTYHDYKKVIEDYNKAVKQAPKFVYSYYNRANTKIQNKNYQGALNDYDKAIFLEPKFAEAYFNRGLTYIYLQKTNKGCIDLSKAGELGVDRAYTAIQLYCK